MSYDGLEVPASSKAPLQETFDVKTEPPHSARAQANKGTLFTKVPTQDGATRRALTRVHPEPRGGKSLVNGIGHSVDLFGPTADGSKVVYVFG
eukprot:2656723-Pyramimonas_sp.AAC.1